MAEGQVVSLWQQVVGRYLTATNGERLEVVYPGRINGDNGPDFRDAVLADGSGLRQGDIEVHTRSGDWYRHGHHRDARYNGIILHVAMWHDHHSATVLQSGRSVPLLALAQALRHQAYLLPRVLPCFQMPRYFDGQTLRELLEAAGEERFRQKAMRFEAGILASAREEAGQALFRGMMRALGYSKNTGPFQELAGRASLDFIESGDGLVRKQALLLGTAGLLPSQRRLGSPVEEEALYLEDIWRSAQRTPVPMHENDWHFSHTYPNNSPVRRIVAQSYLLERYCTHSREPAGSRLMAGLLKLVQEAPAQGPHRVLAEGLTVAGDNFWRSRFDFGAGRRTRASSLMGRGKADEVLVNVVLPFFFALGRLAGKRSLMLRTMELYRTFPRTAANEITRHMAGQLCLEGLPGLTACHQQGLIHIFRNHCREGRCSSCPLARELYPE